MSQYYKSMGGMAGTLHQRKYPWANHRPYFHPVGDPWGEHGDARATTHGLALQIHGQSMVDAWASFENPWVTREPAL